MQRCAIVIEGVLNLILDSGQERTMQRGDIAVQQSTAHKWMNVTGNGLLPARILVVPLNINDPHAEGEGKVQSRLGAAWKGFWVVVRGGNRNRWW